jgi:hypothetical protein
MSVFPVAPGQTVAVSVDAGPLQTIEFRDKDIATPGEATPDEVASVLDRVDGLQASAQDGKVQLVSATVGATATIEVDLSTSSAAAALGLVAGQGRATGEGLAAPRLVSLEREPFALSRGAEMVIVRNGRRRKVAFTSGFTEGRARARDVAAAINSKLRGVARPTRDGRVMLTGGTPGPDASLEVLSGGDGKPDAAAVLGFVGTTAYSRPHRTEAARLVLRRPAAPVSAMSLSAAPIELHLAEGPARLEPHGTLPLSPLDAASPQLQRLVERGDVRLIGGVE